MSLNCPICLSNYREPVCLPCGHIYCQECLTAHVNVHTNTGLTSTCPECRTVFHLTIPDVSYLHPKYRPFISQAARRVYTDLTPDPDSALHRKIKTLETRLASQVKTEEKLMTRCEGLLAAMHAHRNGEHEANKRAMELEKKLQEAFRRVGQMERMLEDQQTRLRNTPYMQENKMLRRNNLELAERMQELEASYAVSEERRLELEIDAYNRPHQHDDASSDGSLGMHDRGGSGQFLRLANRIYAANASDEEWDSHGIKDEDERADDDEDERTVSPFPFASASNAQASTSHTNASARARAKQRERAIKPLPRRVSRGRERDDDSTALLGNAKRARVSGRR